MSTETPRGLFDALGAAAAYQNYNIGKFHIFLGLILYNLMRVHCD